MVMSVGLIISVYFETDNCVFAKRFSY